MSRGDWMQTFTGRQFWPIDPKPEDVCVEDIAHALAMQCRFGGHCRDFYSVAQHSVLVAEQVGDQDKLWVLLHDAAEAYIGDMIRPLKRSGDLGQIFKIHENRIMWAILERFNLPLCEPEAVKHADNVLLMTEKRDLMSDPPDKWVECAEPLSNRIRPWNVEYSELRFLDAFKAYTSSEVAA